MKSFLKFIEEETSDHIEKLARIIHAKTKKISDLEEVAAYITRHVTSHPAYQTAKDQTEADDFGSAVHARVMELRKES